MEAGDQEGAAAWLQSHAPDHQVITRLITEELKDELRANAAEILAAADDDGSKSAPTADDVPDPTRTDDDSSEEPDADSS